MTHKEITIPTILGLFVAILGLGSGLFLLNGQLRLRSSAAADEAPVAVRMTNFSDNSFVVSWHTSKALTGYVQYGEAGKEPDLIVSDERDQQKGEIGNYFTHYVSIRGLKPQTNYVFKIGSGKGIYDDNGKTYQAKTGPSLGNPPVADVAYGMVVTGNNEPADGALIYVDMPGGNTQATIVKPTGSWVISLATARSVDLNSYAQYDKENTELSIFVQGGPLGTSTVKASTANDSPVSQIMLGTNAINPQVNVNQIEKLKILTPVVGQSIENSNIEITGQAPPGAQVTVEVHSDEVINGTVVAGTDGTFRFPVNTNLSPGEHTITVSTMFDGVISRVTRSFVVYAAEEGAVPFYSASPSATLFPSPTIMVAISPMVSPILTITPTKTPTPTIPPRVTNPSTDSAIPNTGNEWITWVILGFGAVMIFGGSFWYRKLDKLS